jgi:hypothetical protein
MYLIPTEFPHLSLDPCRKKLNVKAQIHTMLLYWSQLTSELRQNQWHARMHDDGMTIPKHKALYMYTPEHNIVRWVRHAVGTESELNVKYSLSVPLDYWNSLQADIGSCSAQPSHWPDTEIVNKLDINQSQKFEWTAVSCHYKFIVWGKKCKYITCFLSYLAKLFLNHCCLLGWR